MGFAAGCTHRLLVGPLVLLALLGAALFAVSSGNAAETALSVSPLTVGQGGVTSGSVSGFPAGTPVTINGQLFTASSNGTVNFSGDPVLASTPNLNISFPDSTGTIQNTTLPLQNAANGLPLGLGSIFSLLLGQTLGTLPAQTTVGTPSPPSPPPPTASPSPPPAPTSTGGGASGGEGGQSSNAPNADKVASSTITVSEVAYPNVLVISKVAFSHVAVRSKRPINVTMTIADTRGNLVRGARMSLASVPAKRIGPLAPSTTDQAGRVTFTITPTKLLQLVKGGRLNLIARAFDPAKGSSSATTGKRLISIRTAQPIRLS